MKHLFFALTVFVFAACTTSKTVIKQRFEGKLVYEISFGEEGAVPKDSSAFQIIYAKDSLVRMENNTPLGKQIYIKHIPKNRAYNLLNAGGQNIAIQTIPDSLSKVNNKYTFDYKRKTKTYAGLPAKKVLVSIKGKEQPVEMYYFENYSHDYTNAITGLNGLPVDYTLFINDQQVRYKLVSFEKKAISIDYFGIPSDYQIISTEEFLNLIQLQNEIEE